MEQAKSIIDSTNSAAVDKDYFWLDISTCPLGVKVQLLGEGGVAAYSQYNGKDSFWKAWAPLPKVSEELRSKLCK